MRSCAVCKNVDYVDGFEGHSEYTPGEEARFWCHKGSPAMRGWLAIDEDVFKEMREIAARCEMYEPEEG